MGKIDQAKVSSVASGGPELGHGHDETAHIDFSRTSVARPRWIWQLLVLVLAFGVLGVLFVTGWTPQEKRKAAIASEAETIKNAAPRVSVLFPKRSAPSVEVLLPGQIQAIRETTLFARTSGYLKRWTADIGDAVKEGQLLAEIETPETDMQLEQSKSALAQTRAALEQTKAALKQNEAQLENGKASAELADLTRDRYVNLRASHSAPELEISEKETAAKVAHTVVLANEAAIVSSQANINSAKANIDAAASDVRRLEVLKSFQLVTAPFDGIITSRSIENGSLIIDGSTTAATALFHIAATDPVRVFIDVPQAYAPTIEMGQEVQLLVREFPGHPYTGKVARTSGAIDSASRTLRTEVHVPNADHKLLAGMYVQVKMTIQRARPPLMVPNSALIVNADGNMLAVVRDGIVHFQKVELDGDYGNEFGIASGVSETDAIIANPSERLIENGAVMVVTPQK